MGPGLVGPELLAGFAGRTSVGCLPLFRFLCPSAMSAFLLLSPSTMYQYGIINAIGSHQNGSTCPSPGDKDAHDQSYEPEKEAKLMNVEVDNQNKMEKADMVGMESDGSVFSCMRKVWFHLYTMEPSVTMRLPGPFRYMRAHTGDGTYRGRGSLRAR